MTNSPDWLRPNTIPRSPEDVQNHYDDVSKTYDDFVRASGYEAPDAMAKLYAGLVPDDERGSGMHRVLDSGCGTGLFGFELARRGVKHIFGCDVSQKMLDEAAEKKVYSSLVQCDLLGPLPWENGYFSAVGYCGVFSRFDEMQILEILKESIRITKKRGLILFSHRSDLIENSDLMERFDKQSDIVVNSITQSSPYLPGMPGYEDIRVQYIALKRE